MNATEHFDSRGHDLRDQMEQLAATTIDSLEAEIGERQEKIAQLRRFVAELRQLTLPVIGLPVRPWNIETAAATTAPSRSSPPGEIADDELPKFLTRQDQPPPPRMGIGERLQVHLARTLGGSLAIARTA